MWNMKDVIKINYRHSYIFHVVFDAGVSGDADFHEYIEKGPIFAPIKSKDLFIKRAVIEGGTISWPNGADVAPETLYEKASGNKANSSDSLKLLCFKLPVICDVMFITSEAPPQTNETWGGSD